MVKVNMLIINFFYIERLMFVLNKNWLFVVFYFNYWMLLYIKIYIFFFWEILNGLIFFEVERFFILYEC